MRLIGMVNLISCFCWLIVVLMLIILLFVLISGFFEFLGLMLVLVWMKLDLRMCFFGVRFFCPSVLMILLVMVWFSLSGLLIVIMCLLILIVFELLSVIVLNFLFFLMCISVMFV